MAGTYFVTGNDVTLRFEWTLPIVDALSIVGDCAEYLWNHGYGDHGTEEAPILFANITDQQKVDIVDRHFADVAVNAANTFKSQKAQEAARASEDAHKHSL
jgi:hypothetical protein